MTPEEIRQTVEQLQRWGRARTAHSGLFQQAAACIVALLVRMGETGLHARQPYPDQALQTLVSFVALCDSALRLTNACCVLAPNHDAEELLIAAAARLKEAGQQCFKNPTPAMTPSTHAQAMSWLYVAADDLGRNDRVAALTAIDLAVKRIRFPDAAVEEARGHV